MRIDKLKRRELITLLGGTAVWPLAASHSAVAQSGGRVWRIGYLSVMYGSTELYAQQPKMPIIGFLSSRSPGESAGVVAAFRQGLGEAGFTEGRNVFVAFRWAEGHYDRLPALAAELVELGVTVLFTAGGPPSAFAAKAATQTIPIVFSAAIDPDRIGLVTSLNRPGGNVTGMSIFPSEVAAKNVQLLVDANSPTLCLFWTAVLGQFASSRRQMR